jgi:hypothetical protein
MRRVSDEMLGLTFALGASLVDADAFLLIRV